MSFPILSRVYLCISIVQCAVRERAFLQVGCDPKKSTQPTHASRLRSMPRTDSIRSDSDSPPRFAV